MGEDTQIQDRMKLLKMYIPNMNLTNWFSNETIVNSNNAKVIIILELGRYLAVI